MPADQYLPTRDDRNWKAVSVPSNWYLQGEDLSGTVWYRHTFKVDPQLQGKVAQLVFAGVDYTADVWLNGQYLGFHEGYFEPFSFLVSDQLKFQENNVLVVKVDSPYEEPGRVWSLHKRLIKGVFTHHDARPGGAWSLKGQAQNTGGIWGPVSLKVSDQVAIDAVKVTPQIKLETHEGRADLSLSLTYTGAVPKDFDLSLTLEPHNFSGAPSPPVRQKKTLNPGVNQFTFKLTQREAQLWWTWEHGAPNLYKLTTEIFEANQRLDCTETVFGFRTIELEPGSQTWRLNGKRIFLRGTNYISSQWLSEMSPSKYAQDLDLMKRANINAIRVHAHIEAETFYRLCDQAGIVVWQDFPLQWGYTDDPGFAVEAIRQAKGMVNLLYNHPSIITWSLHNEPPWDAPWMKLMYADYNPEQNRKLDDTLFANLRAIDPSRHLARFGQAYPASLDYRVRRTGSAKFSFPA